MVAHSARFFRFHLVRPILIILDGGTPFFLALYFVGLSKSTQLSLSLLFYSFTFKASLAGFTILGKAISSLCPTPLSIKASPCSVMVFNIRRSHYSPRIQRIDRSAVRDGIASEMHGIAKIVSSSPAHLRPSNDAPSVQTPIPISDTTAFLSFTPRQWPKIHLPMSIPSLCPCNGPCLLESFYSQTKMHYVSVWQSYLPLSMKVAIYLSILMPPSLSKYQR